MVETIINNFHLEKILWIVKNKIAYMIIIGALGGIAGGSYSYLTSNTIYRAAVSFYIYSNPDYVYDSSVNITNSEFTTAKNLAESYILILKSDTVMEKVIEASGLSYSISGLVSSIGTRVMENTAVFYVYVYDTDPQNAMIIANAIGDVAPSEISRIVKSGGIEVIDYAKMPTAPYSSANVMKFAVLGLGGGFGASAALFLLAGLLDTTIRRRYELKLAFNIPIMGDIPMMVGAGENGSKVLGEESPFAVKESYNVLRANMLFTGKGEKCPVYVITSAEQDEGKTLNSVNLAVSYAQLGKRILLIDGDMRNVSIADMLNVKSRSGLSQYLAGLVVMPDVVCINDCLDLVSGGEIPPNPSELIGSGRMHRYLEAMKEEYDCIFVDMPPVGIVSDALLLSQAVTAYVLVIRACQSKMDKEKGAVTLLEQVNANICGIIFNGIDPKSQDYVYKSYSYNYKYGQDKERKRTRTQKGRGRKGHGR